LLSPAEASFAPHATQQQATLTPEFYRCDSTCGRRACAR
jgi:hypothetical protein